MPEVLKEKEEPEGLREAFKRYITDLSTLREVQDKVTHYQLNTTFNPSPHTVKRATGFLSKIERNGNSLIKNAEERLGNILKEKEIPKFNDNSAFQNRELVESIIGGIKVAEELIYWYKEHHHPKIQIASANGVLDTTEKPLWASAETREGKISAQIPTEVKPIGMVKPEVASGRSVDEKELRWFSENISLQQLPSIVEKDIEQNYPTQPLKLLENIRIEVPKELYGKPLEEQKRYVISAIEKNPLPYYKRLAENPDVFQRIEPDLYQKYYEEFIKQQEKKQQQEAVAIITTERIMAERERIADEMRRKIEEEFLAKREKKEEEKPEEKTA